MSWEIYLGIGIEIENCIKLTISNFHLFIITRGGWQQTLTMALGWGEMVQTMPIYWKVEMVRKVMEEGKSLTEMTKLTNTPFCISFAAGESVVRVEASCCFCNLGCLVMI